MKRIEVQGHWRKDNTGVWHWVKAHVRGPDDETPPDTEKEDDTD